MAERTSWQSVAKRVRVPMGFITAILFLATATPSLKTMLLSLLIVGPGLWLRAYAAGYVRKNAELTTSGPYAYTRNPLYLGSMLIAFGFAGAAGSWMLLIVLAALFAVIYIPTIQGEEAFLRTRFGNFDAYAAAVPRILPRLTPAPTNEERGQFSKALYLHHREYNALMGAGAIYVALGLKLWAAYHDGMIRHFMYFLVH
jgi:protein-S-isoprenylcysteine O-methyltransferase Ste14